MTQRNINGALEALIHCAAVQKETQYLPEVIPSSGERRSSLDFDDAAAPWKS